MSQQEMSQQQSGPLEAIQIVVRPVRFTADVEAMRRFLEVLGLRTN